MRNFKGLKIWQKGFEIAIKSYKLTGKFPPDQKYSLVSQINRSAVSIPSNIAEGSSRTSDKDYNRFLEMALGSCFELETQLLISRSVNFGEKELRDEMLLELDQEEKMIISFMTKLDK